MTCPAEPRVHMICLLRQVFVGNELRRHSNWECVEHSSTPGAWTSQTHLIASSRATGQKAIARGQTPTILIRSLLEQLSCQLEGPLCVTDVAAHADCSTIFLVRLFVSRTRGARLPL